MVLPVYKYEPLGEREKGHKTRLLTLLPGKATDAIEIILEIQSLDDSITPYKALSYTWGSTDDPGEIVVSTKGYETSGTLRVTRNLAIALNHFRDKKSEVVLWIDAICINQGSIPERNYQVKNMARIYSLTSAVVIWLGAETQSTKLALRTLENWAEGVHVQWWNQTMEAEAQNKNAEKLVDLEQSLDFPEDIHEALQGIFSCSWFERLWIWQEIALAPQDSSYLLVGRNSIAWKTFATAVFVLHTKVKRIAKYPDPKDKQRTELVYQVCNSTSTKRLRTSVFADLARATGTSKCTDERDRVYALLSLLQGPKADLEIEVDYSKTISEIYQNLVLHDFRILGFARLFSLCDRHDTKSMPSWVPDLSNLQNIEPIRRHFASGPTSVSFKDLGAGKLQLTGVHIDEVAYISEAFSPRDPNVHSDPQVIHQELQHLFAFCVQHLAVKLPSLTPKPYFVPLCRLLKEDCFSETFYPENSKFMKYDVCLQDLMNVVLGPFAHATPSVSRVFPDVEVLFPGKKLFVTKTGHFGLAPSSTRPGDQFVVLLGCEVGAVLRPVTIEKLADSSVPEYLYVGEASCLDFMAGEGILGPLPAGIQLCMHRPEGRDNIFWRFLNRETGQILRDDPRLDGVSLPVGWRRREGLGVMMFLNEVTDEEWEADRFDPRLMPEELKKRDVPLREFVLI